MKKSCSLMPLLLPLCLLINGCKTQKASETTTRDSTMVSRETVYKTKFDSVFVLKHDSIYIEKNGDSVLIERWHTQYLSKIKVDTVRTGDTIYIMKNVEHIKHDVAEVNRALNGWQRFIQRLGYVGLLLLGLIGIYGVFKFYLKFKK